MIVDVKNYNKTEIVSIGDRIFSGKFFLHSKFKRVTNFTNGNSIISIVTEEIGRGPATIVVEGMDVANINDLYIGKNFISINYKKYPLDKRKLFNSQIKFRKINSNKLEKNLEYFEKSLLDLSHPKSLAFLINSEREKYFNTTFDKNFLKRIKGGVYNIFNDKLINGIKKVKGIGFGLTPSGDDFIAGFLIALYVIDNIYNYDVKFKELRETIYRISKSENLLSNSFLSLSKDGFLFDRIKKLIISILNESEQKIFNRTKNLLSIGDTSGSDLGVGFLLTIKKGGILCF
ncbi:hypothetical protein CVT91_08805 [Candidatus Atribacteria bacterium HGW-Atribacteria-1]|nr:MAG: hypothetical protein CVT91_08805 [Candidatus Atribacteria bacterium HGW-Atribacteria-1]